MSTEQSVDPQLLEQTKQQIRSLVAEIAQISKSSVTPLEFYSEFLNRVVQALAAVGGAVWTPGEGGGLQLEYQINLQQTRLAESREDQIRHHRLLQQVLTQGEGMLVAPHSGSGDDDGASNPTEFLLVLSPLKADQQTRGVVEVFQRPGTRPTTQRGYLRFLLQMCELASDFLKTRELRHFTDRQQLWSQLEQFTRSVHLSLDPHETAFTIANEGRRLIECDRVSVAIRHGRKCKIEAISGQDTLDKRSNVVTLLNQLTTAVAATGEPMWYTGDTSNMAPQVEDAVQAYVDEQHSKTVAVLPLKRPAEPGQIEDEEDKRETIGALVVEQIENARPREGMLQRVDVVTEHSSAALSNALAHHDLFLMPLWKTLGKSRVVVEARHLPKTISALIAVVGVIAALFLIPADFDLEGRGVLQPVIRREVFAGIDGDVTDVEVDHGDMVTAGQVVARMRNTDLEVAIRDLLGQLQESDERLDSLRYLTLNSNNRVDQQQRDQAAAEIQALEQKRNALQNELELSREKKKKLEVASPIDGQIVTWDVYDNLIFRPVQRGQVLMQVADPSKDWELEVYMPEDRMGHIAQAQSERGADLPVKFILATDPATEYQGRVTEAHLSAEVRGDQGNTVLIRVAFDKSQLPPNPRPGAGVQAQVHCGRASIGYVWFHDLVAFVQSRILFRFF
ncbi:MAG: HlyD family efflux transporter periplasmic adaptor subunit [Pirellulales bacterium]|nr:HlyD family efflux transporter periplasmic adaptor subunit [Pirellulales bacterium]